MSRRSFRTEMKKQYNGSDDVEYNGSSSTNEDDRTKKNPGDEASVAFPPKLSRRRAHQKTPTSKGKAKKIRDEQEAELEDAVPTSPVSRKLEFPTESRKRLTLQDRIIDGLREDDLRSRGKTYDRTRLKDWGLKNDDLQNRTRTNLEDTHSDSEKSQAETTRSDIEIEESEPESEQSLPKSEPKRPHKQDLRHTLEGFAARTDNNQKSRTNAGLKEDGLESKRKREASPDEKATPKNERATKQQKLQEAFRQIEKRGSQQRNSQ